MWHPGFKRFIGLIGLIQVAGHAKARPYSVAAGLHIIYNI
jgi:hypothetical protein